ncbi:uncharacterized protein LTR77_003439 [Saxophila tyrrhenica]|uniref:FHA domain-containing protein n=1 Tax=Saxophila tyrrhenica TaxID=1690608 RepID=A0AAV9PDL7_9PEZI|nr:hypothetical protein LTR77_003439 [Saxophila tyrrhenica]
MWVLSCDGDHFGGKRLWLRPGTTHLLGRTTGQAENGERIRHIDHKSVSRKHLTLEVLASPPEDITNIYAKSQLRLKDGSKIGTTINEDKIKGEEKDLSGGQSEVEFTIRLGNYEHLFHLVWKPVVLSLTHLGKKSRDGALATQRERFQNADVKLAAEYITNVTTHCIAKKRNTPGNLQALLQGRWLVTESYVDALASAVKRSGPESEGKLEQDFDSNWPDEMIHIVPVSSEPIAREDEYLKPNAERAEVFQNLIFVFLSQAQYDSLLSVITAGGGKAFLFELDPETTKVEDMVAFISEIAGNKRSGQFKLSQQPGKGGVIVVRIGDREMAGREIMRALDVALDQRSIEQGELLDVILTLDTSKIKQEVPDASQSLAGRDNASREGSQAPRTSLQASRNHEHSRGGGKAPEEPSHSAPVRETTQHRPERSRGDAMAGNSQPTDEQAQENSRATLETSPSERAATARKRNRRIITQSRLKGFDDDFDPSQFSKPASQSPDQSFDQAEPSQAADVQDMDVDEPSQAAPTQQSSRKRPAPSLKDEEENMYDRILTGHNTMKRRKLAAGHDDADTRALAQADRKDAEQKAKAKKKAKEMDVMAEIQARRKKEDEERRKMEEQTREALDGLDIAAMKNLAVIEEMDVPMRERPARRSAADANTGQGDRWDPAWNGRKNFKKFRPQGQGDGNAPRLPRVIVALEEVPKKAHGIGEEYWLSNSTAKSKGKSKSQSQSQSQVASQSQRIDLEDNTGTSRRFQRRLKESRREDQDSVGAILPDEIAGHARDEALEETANANEAAMNSTPSQTFGTESQRRAAGKRPATEQSGPPAKKARQSQRAPSTRQTITIDDDDDDDALKFRRRRRG